MTFLVTYNLRNEENDKDRRHIRNSLAKYPHTKLGESCYIIETSLNAYQVFDDLRDFLESDDDLYVIPVTQQVVGAGPSKQWLVSKLQKPQYEKPVSVD